MDWIRETFSNRELSFIIWGLVIFTGVLIKKSIRKSLFKLVAFIFSSKLFFIFLSVFLYIGAVSFVLWKVGVWEIYLLKDTIFWIIGVGLVLMVNINNALDDPGFFKKTAMDNLKLLIILEFITNLYVFGFWIEFIITPIITFIGLVLAVSELDKKNELFTKFLNAIFIFYGLVVIVFSIINIASDFSNFASMKTLKSFVLPLIFTLVYLPFLYFTALMMKYEIVFLRLGFFNNDSEILKHAKKKIIWKFKFKLGRLNEWYSNVGNMRVERKEDINEMINPKSR